MLSKFYLHFFFHFTCGIFFIINQPSKFFKFFSLMNLYKYKIIETNVIITSNGYLLNNSLYKLFLNKFEHFKITHTHAKVNTKVFNLC